MNIRCIFLLILSAVIVFTAVAAGQEKKVKQSDLPAAVQKALAEQSRGAIVRAFSTEKENGQTYYEAEMTVDGHSKDVQVDAAGAIVEVEEQVHMNSLPPDVNVGLRTKAGKGKLVKVETITKHEKLVAYEAQVLTNGKKSEVQVGPGGMPLDHEE
jgi:hypothetical protein